MCTLRKITNICVINNSQAYYWGGLVNSTEHNTAEWVEERLYPMITNLLDEGVCIVGFAVDNEAVNKH